MADKTVKEIFSDDSNTVVPHADAGESPRPRRRRVLKRVAIGIGVFVLLLVVLAAALYSFGGMERPSADKKAAFAAMVAQGTAAPVQARFVIPVPGCRCHSDDPVEQAQHASYRIRECSSCH